MAAVDSLTRCAWPGARPLIKTNPSAVATRNKKAISRSLSGQSLDTETAAKAGRKQDDRVAICTYARRGH